MSGSPAVNAEAELWTAQRPPASYDDGLSESTLRWLLLKVILSP